MPRAAAPPSLKARALRHLARREHSRAELERKLAAPSRSAARASQARASRGAEHVDACPSEEDPAQLREQIQHTLDELAERGLLSDERTAESLLAGRGQRLGSRRLKQTLQAKGLDAELVSATVQRARATEFERALALWQRRFGTDATAPIEAAERARQMRFLAARGFDADIIRRVVKGCVED